MGFMSIVEIGQGRFSAGVSRGMLGIATWGVGVGVGTLMQVAEKIPKVLGRGNLR
jgi:hypothetical protein